MFEQIAKCINENDNFIILTHKNADGDCIGSAFALKLMLEQIGKKATVHLEEKNPLPNICSITKGVEDEVLFSEYTLITVDCADLGRIGSRTHLFEKAKFTINLDHHLTNDQYAMFNYVDTNVSATGEIIYELAEYMGIPINYDIAHNIFLAIISDSGRFSYSSTTPRTHIIASELMKTGINVAEISDYLFNNDSLAEVRMKAFAYNSIEVFFDGKVSVATLTRKQMVEAGGDDDSTGGIVTIPRSVRGNRIAIFFKETEEGYTKISFRSKGEDVSKVAQKFGGGGHIRASACLIEQPLDVAKQMVLEEIGKIV